MSTDDEKLRKSDPEYGTHAYDGIEESDNPLPGWWQWLLYGSIVFAVIYWFDVQMLKVHPTAAKTFAAEAQEKAEKDVARGEISADLLVSMSHSDAAVTRGKQTFTTTCAACHRADGGGVIGPNLTDDSWLHGGKPLDIYKSVHDGWAEKGMPNWGATLGDQRVIEVAAYVLTIKGSNVPGGKAPQGEKEAD